MAAENEKTEEKARVVRECLDLWECREEVEVLAKDRGLFRDDLRPSHRRSTDYLRAWLETRRLVIQEYERYAPSRDQVTIRRWLRPRS